MHIITAALALLPCTLCSASAIFLQEVSGRAISPDNTCGKNGTGGGADGYKCPSDVPCCSANGFCGSTNAYCLTTAGCHGWCGNSTDYCTAAAGCQSAFGSCTSNASSSTGSTSTPGTNANGRCGPGFGTCASNECCSLAGFFSANRLLDYCNAPDCQFNYGPACDANKIPSGTNTSSIPRTQIGSVLYGSDGIYDCKTVGDMALTFDDGPFIYTSHILDLLDKYSAKATFFITGNNNGAQFRLEYCRRLLTVVGKGQIDNTSTEYPALIKRMYDGGHQVASHTWSHADLCNITSAQRKDEMYKNEMALRNIVGIIPTYMRPPYSSCTAGKSGLQPGLPRAGTTLMFPQNVAAKPIWQTWATTSLILYPLPVPSLPGSKLIPLQDLDTSDYLNDSPALIQNSKTIFDNALAAKSPTSDDFLIIGHDIHNQTANVLVEYMLQQIQSKGYKPVTVGDCLGDPKANW
ncbi:unnamed protein product [Diplocarpon coronariae]